MRLRKYCMPIVLTCFSFNGLPICAVDDFPPTTVEGHYPDPALGDGEEGLALPDTAAALRGDSVLTSAYRDTLDILRNSNRCSEFFGGPAFAVHVFNQFIAGIRKDYFSRNIGIRMSGTTTNGSDHELNKRFRLFEKVTLNRDGPFYQRRLPNAGYAMPNVGTFEPGTRQARMLTLLHELGHLVEGPDGNWLLPNDGDDEGLSRENSRTIQRICGQEILKETGKSGKGTHSAGKLD